MAATRPLTIVLRSYDRAPSPGRDGVVLALRTEFPAACIDTRVDTHAVDVLRVRVEGPTAAELAEVARLYLGSLGLRYAITRPAPGAPLSTRLRPAA